MPMTARGWSSAMNMRTGAFGVDSQATVDDGGPSKTVIGAGAVQRPLLACGLRAFSPFCAMDASAHIAHPTPAGTYEPTSRPPGRSEEHTSELQSLMRISYAVSCLNTKTIKQH